MKSFLTFLLVSIGFISFGQEPVLIGDIAKSGESTFQSRPDILNYKISNQLFLIFDHEEYGEEIWRTNGTNVGTQLVRDIRVGPYGSQPEFIGSMDNQLLFVADTDNLFNPLWITNGSALGTRMMLDEDGNPILSPRSVVAMGNDYYIMDSRTIYFSEDADDPLSIAVDLNDFSISLSHNYMKFQDKLIFRGGQLETGYECWISDGTPAGTKLLKDIHPGTETGLHSEFYTGENQFYFIGEDSIHGEELWVSDGTEEGTQMVRDLTEGAENSDIELLYLVDEKLYFVFDEGNSYRNLWKTDGTSEGTIMVGDGIRPNSPVLFQDTLFFRAGSNLWKADGTNEIQITEFPVYSFVVTEKGIYFSSNQDIEGNGVWHVTTQGTHRFIKQISDKNYHDIDNFYAVGNTVYFSAETDSFGNELWATDGTAAGTQMLTDLAPGPEDGFESYRDMLYTDINGRLIFVARNPEYGRELWISEGSPENTQLLKDLTPRTTDIRLFSAITEYRGNQYFITDSALWKTDGSAENTEKIRTGIFMKGLTVLNDKLMFTGRSPFFTSTLFLSDGTPEGTLPLFDTTNAPTTRVRDFRVVSPVFNGHVYFEASTEAFGDELWKTDGTVEGTLMVKDIEEGPDDSNLFLSDNRSVIFKNELYFVAYNEILGQELWKTDGTGEGTIPLSDINPAGNSDIANLTANDDFIVFGASDGSSFARKLWRTDGTVEGTQLVKDIVVGYRDFVRMGNDLFFHGTDEFGSELWKTDGTVEGTERITDIRPGEAGSSPGNLFVLDGSLYFSASDSTGRRIYVTDGSTEGTRRINDIEIINELFVAGDYLFYTENVDLVNRRLWRYDPRTGHSYLIQEFSPGFFNSGIQYLAYLNNRLYYTASDEDHGREIWTLTPYKPELMVNAASEFCTEGDTLLFKAVAENAGPNPSFTWFLNNSPIQNQDSETLALSAINEGDAIRSLLLSDPGVWTEPDSVFSEPVIIEYTAPTASIEFINNTLTASEGDFYSWFLNGEALEDTTRVIEVTESGTYLVEVFNAQGCSSVSDPVTLLLSSDRLNSSTNPSDLSYYPNPVVESLYLRLDRSGDFQLSLYTIYGQKVMAEIVWNTQDQIHEIPMNHLESGIYLLQIDTGSERITKTIMLE